MKRPANPFSNLEQLFEQMEANLEEAAQWWESEPMPAVSGETTAVRVDIEDTGDELVLTAELPGFSTEDIDVRVTDHTFQLDAEHETESTEETAGEFLQRERYRASVRRSITLPDAVETDDISATYDNGVLTVRLPKSEPTAQGAEIEID